MKVKNGFLLDKYIGKYYEENFDKMFEVDDLIKECYQ